MCINLSSDSIRKALILLQKEPQSLEKLKITQEDITNLQKYGLNIIHIEENDTYYLDNTVEDNFLIESFKSKKSITEKWLEISDVRVGNKYFDEESLRYVLQKAQDEGYNRVYIAGDLTTGHPKAARNGKWKYIKTEYSTAEKQAEYVVSILSDYPSLSYYAINGIRDKSFEKYGEINPLRLVAKELEEKGIKFVHIDDFTCNILMNGCIKRMTYIVKMQRPYTKSYPTDRYLEDQLENIGSNILRNGVNYKLRCLQVGNVVFDGYDLSANIYITNCSGFVFDSENIMNERTSIPSGTFCTVEFKNEAITSFKSKIVRMPRDFNKK